MIKSENVPAKEVRPRACRFCNGSKYVRFTPVLKGGRRLPETGCPKCGGTGLRSNG